ncbi:MAG TPA: ethylbenzene dehydrogenase-related protein, partial [Caldilineaceae bacterium]|nr:ethylbenzene dehydrogenase-related protein [Caldilineaceae bacterium]
ASPLWEGGAAVEIPLSAQIIVRPISPEARVKSMTARSLYNGDSLAFLLEWEDASDNSQTVRVQDFRDGAAMQFPLLEGQPFFCMGQEGGNVNIWHWKADWQADMLAMGDMETAYPNMHIDYYFGAEESDDPRTAEYTDVAYVTARAVDNLFAAPLRTSAVEDLIAGGFGGLTSQGMGGQNVQGYGVWQDGRWRVIFSRALSSGEAEDASFALDKVYSVAFAAWDGANSERNGTKSTSQWVTLQFGKAEMAASAAEQPAAAAKAKPQRLILGQTPGWWMIVTLVTLLVFVVIGALIFYRLPE